MKHIKLQKVIMLAALCGMLCGEDYLPENKMPSPLVIFIKQNGCR
jgi:hypothetical protein